MGSCDGKVGSGVVFRQIIKAARSADTTQRLLDLGAEPVGYTPEEAARFLREEVALWAAVVKASGARAD